VALPDEHELDGLRSIGSVVGNSQNSSEGSAARTVSPEHNRTRPRSTPGGLRRSRAPGTSWSSRLHLWLGRPGARIEPIVRRVWFCTSVRRFGLIGRGVSDAGVRRAQASSLTSASRVSAVWRNRTGSASENEQMFVFVSMGGGLCSWKPAWRYRRGPATARRSRCTPAHSLSDGRHPNRHRVPRAAPGSSGGGPGVEGRAQAFAVLANQRTPASPVAPRPLQFWQIATTSGLIGCRVSQPP
jgi:hypothetical protein